MNPPEPSSGSSAAAGSPDRDPSAGGAAGAAGADSTSDGGAAEAQPPSTACVQIRVATAREESLQFRIVSTDAVGTETAAWSVSGTCFQDSLRSSVCYGDVPVGGTDQATSFKVQARPAQATDWLDLEIPLRVMHGETPLLEQRVVFSGADMAAWLSGYHEDPGSWCGPNPPAPGSDWLSGALDIGPLSDLEVPPNTIRLGPPLAPGSTEVGAKSVTDDPQFLTMWQRAVSGSDDVDADGVPDEHDNCIGRATTIAGDQTDANHDGLGDDVCESFCYVPSTDPDSTYFDYDGDGVDDVCDDDYVRFNPSQYAIQ